MHILGPNPERDDGPADRSRLDLSWAEASKRLTPLNLLTSRAGAEADAEAAEEGGSIDLLLLGLVERLPRPDQYWSLEDRAKWLRTAATIFALVYKTSAGDEGEIGIVLSKRQSPAAKSPDIAPAKSPDTAPAKMPDIAPAKMPARPPVPADFSTSADFPM